jgi:membrane-associated protease RseP (regulator of RpoE activity)
MRKRSIITVLTSLALAGGVGGSALAKPDSSGPPRDTPDSFHATMTAGKGRLGIGVIQISPELRAHLGAPGDRGVLVDAVKTDSPAARAGLRVGDVIVEVDGEAASSAADVLDALSDRKTDDTVPIAVIRAGHRTELRATLEDDPGPTWRSSERGRLRPFEGFDGLGGPDAAQTRRALDEARRRIDELERRIQRLERRDSRT